MGSHERGVEKQNHHSGSAGHIALDAAQDMSDFLDCECIVGACPASPPPALSFLGFSIRANYRKSHSLESFIISGHYFHESEL